MTGRTSSRRSFRNNAQAYELSTFLQNQDERLQERLAREKAQRSAWLGHQEQVFSRAERQQATMERTLSAVRNSADRQREQLDEVGATLLYIMDRQAKQDDPSSSFALNTPRTSTRNSANNGFARRGDAASAPADEMIRIRRSTSRLQVEATSEASQAPTPGTPSSMTKRSRASSAVFWAEMKDTKLDAFVKSQYFDAISATVISINALVIGYSSQYEMQRAIEALQQTRPDGQIAFQAVQNDAFRISGHVFSGFYLVELLLKLTVFRLRFFTAPDEKYWNLFDTFLVITGIYEVIQDVISDDAGGASITWIRVLRLLKMLKMLRVIRVMKFFRDLRIMLLSIVGSLRILFWSIMMLGLIMYIFGICFLQAVTAHLQETEPLVLQKTSIEEDIMEHWGSVETSMRTLLMAITGGNDWKELAAPLWQVGAHYYILFLFYIAFIVFAVLNVLTGIFVDQAMQMAALDRDNVIHEALEREDSFARNMKELFSSVDKDGSGQISWSEFKKHVNDKNVQSYFAAMELDVSDAKQLFTLLDNNGNKTLEIGEFIDGCTRLKGGAKSMDLITLMEDTKYGMGQIGVFMGFVKDCFDAMLKSALNTHLEGAS